jgi:hypothetical protein
MYAKILIFRVFRPFQASCHDRRKVEQLIPPWEPWLPRGDESKSVVSLMKRIRTGKSTESYCGSWLKVLMSGSNTASHSIIDVLSMDVIRHFGVFKKQYILLTFQL